MATQDESKKKNKAASLDISKMVRDIGLETKKEIQRKSGELEDHLDLTLPAGPPQSKIFSIIDYIEQSWGLGMKLYPVQKFLTKLFYFLPLEDREKTIKVTDMLGTKVRYHLTEREYLQFLYNEGRCNISEQDHPRNLLILPIGRRGGKTTLSAIFASYEIYRLLNLHDPQKYYGMNNVIQLLNVAVDKEQAGILFQDVTGHLVKCEYFKPFLANSTQQKINIRTPADIEKFGPVDRQHQNGRFTSLTGKASLRVSFKSCVARGLRGHANSMIILDEMAHYIEDGDSSAKNIYDAITPSNSTFNPKDPETGLPYETADGVPLSSEGRILCISSPLNKSGKFYDLYMQAMRGGEAAVNMLAVQAPTWEINPTVPPSIYSQKYHEDPAVFMTEFGAEFSDRVRGWIEREEDLMACVDPMMQPQLIGTPRYPHQMGIDLALMNDYTAITITSPVNGKIELVYHEMWKAGEDWRITNPHLGNEYSTPYCKRLGDAPRLEFDEIGEWIVALTKRFYITDGIFDRWNGIPLEQALLKRGFTQFRCEYFQRDLASKIYQNAKMMIMDRALRLYERPTPLSGKHSGPIAELLGLQAKQVSKNVVVVEAPEGVGNHDDFSDSFVRAVWLTSERMHNMKHTYGRNPGVPSSGTPQMSANRYSMMKARTHGAFMERRAPSPGRPRMGRFSR